MRLINVLCFLLVSVLAGGQAHAVVPQDETATLNKWLDARYEEELQRSPQMLTYLGRKEHYGQIDDYSEAGDDAELAALLKTLTQMREQFDYNKLAPQGKISYDFWVYRVEQAVDNWIASQEH